MFGLLNLGTGLFLVFVVVCGVPRSSTTPRMFCITTAPINTWLRRWRCLLRLALLFWYVLQIVISFSGRR